MPCSWLNAHFAVFEAKNVVVHHSYGVDVCLIVAIHGAQTKQQQHLFSKCLRPLQTYTRLGSRLDLPPSHTLCTQRNISDGDVAVRSSYVKAHVMTDKGGGQKKLPVGTDTRR